MSLTESQKNRLYYEKNKARLLARKHDYQTENKEKIAQMRKERRTVKMVKKTVLTVEQNKAQTKPWWGQP